MMAHDTAFAGEARFTLPAPCTRAARLLGTLAALLAAGSCGSGPGSAPPNVLLISVDSLRADRTEGVLSKVETGPRVRSLASQGTVFTQAISAAPWTTPSMMTVLTGLYPWSHHVRDHNFVLAPGTLLLSERLRARGYATAAIVPDTTLRQDFGFARGFDYYDNGGYGHDTLSSSAMAGKAIAWIQAHRERPYFCWIHLWDPHYNYIPPAPFNSTFPSAFRPPPGTRYDLSELKFHEAPLRPEETAYLMSQYEGEILYTDQFIGDILDSLAQAEHPGNTLIVLLADHGEEFQEHRWLTHTAQLYDEVSRVPLIFVWPGRIQAGRKIDLPVSLVLVAPTILDLLGTPPAAGEMEGKSLGPTLLGPGDPDPGPVVSETIRQNSLTSWRSGGWKYILNMDTCTGELYDLAADPGESRNLEASEPARASSMRAALIAFYRDNAYAKRVPVTRMTHEREEDLERLRSLGYVPPVSQGPATFQGHTDPLHCR